MPAASDSNIDKRVYGLIGDFEGDDILVQELQWCRGAYLVDSSSAENKPPLARLVSLLGSLPLRGRNAVVRTILKDSPYRDAVLHDLMEYCFQKEDEEEEATSDKEDEDEFVIIAYEQQSQEQKPKPDEKIGAPKPLNSNKFHIFQVVLVLMAVCGKAGAEACRYYLNHTASTRFRSKVLILAVTNFSEEEFGNEELFQHYLASPQSVQASLLKAAKHGKKSVRKDFLQRVYLHNRADNAGLDFDSLVYLDSDFMDKTLKAMPYNKDQNEIGCTFSHWGKHGDVYLSYIRQRMSDIGNDQLRLGLFWRNLMRAIDKQSMVSRHVYALTQLLQDFSVCHTDNLSVSNYRQRDPVLKHLQEQSAAGQDVLQFEGVERITMVDKGILLKLTQKERLQEASKHLESRDWERFSAFADLVPLHELPYEKYFGSITKDEYWSSKYILKGDFDPFWKTLAMPALPKGAPAGPARMKILQSWAALNDRVKPTVFSEADISSRGWKLATLWSDWYDIADYFLANDGAVSKVLRELSAECLESPRLNPKISVYAKFALDVLEMAVSAFDLVQEHLPAATALKPLYRLLDAISYAKLSKSEDQSAKDVSDKCVEIICDRILPLMDKTLQFDPTDDKNYIDYSKGQQFYSRLSGLIGRVNAEEWWSSSEKLALSIAKTVLNVHKRASVRPPKTAAGVDTQYVVVAPPKKKQKLVFYNFGNHQGVENHCRSLVKQLLAATLDVTSFDKSMSKTLWQIVLSESTSLQPYLAACNAYRPKHLADEEKESLVKRCLDFVLATHKNSPSTWSSEISPVGQELAKLGLLEEVFENETIPQNVAKKILVKHGGFANEKVQQSLKEETYSASAEDRAKGLIAWMEKACKSGSCALIAEAFSFAASRVKNESGIHRRTVFYWLEANFNSVVSKSLADDTSDDTSHKAISSAILDMQNNDLSRLDCVGRQVCFPRLPKYVLNTVIGHDPTKLCTERRQLWADCAIQMDWNLQEALGGEGQTCYSWPLDRYGLQSATWVSRRSVEATYSEPSRSTTTKLAQLRNFSQYIKDVEVEDVFGPVQCVDMLERALGKVWLQDLPSAPLRLNGQFPDNEEAAKALLERLLVLYRLCDMSWQESELLTSTFDSVFGALNKATATEQDLERAHTLLEQLCTIHGGNFCAIPRVSQACDKLFRCAVSIRNSDASMGNRYYISQWLPRWQDVYLETWREPQESPAHDRLRIFLLKYASECEPDSWRPELSKDQRVSADCNMARELLSMSPSALLLEDVRDVLFTRRQDILLQYVRKPVSLDGVFAKVFDYEYGEPEVEVSSVDEFLFNFINKEALLGCHAEVSVHYARYARGEASNKRLDLKSKIDAISKFTSAPSTQHDGVLEALQSDLDDAVRESLINQVFTLDSPWHILGFLLSQKAIEKNDQRTTSTLLRYVARHVHIDKVVRVAGLLLKNPRRKKLSFQLHKGVLQMLFDAETPEAAELLEAEWKKDDLLEGVRFMFVKNCVNSIASGKGAEWETTVLLDVAKNPDFSLELKFFILAPAAPYETQSMEIEIPVGVEKDEVLEKFRRNSPTPVNITSTNKLQTIAIDSFRTILQEFENAPKSPLDEQGTLQLLAKLKRWSLDDMFGTDPAENQPVLDQMALLLKNHSGDTDQSNSEAEVLPDHATQFTHSFCTTLFATAVCNLLSRNELISKRRTDKESLLKIEEVLGESYAAQKFQSCVSVLLDAVLDMPMRQQAIRGLILSNLGGLLSNVKGRLHPKVYELLITKPFSNELKLTKFDTRAHY